MKKLDFYEFTGILAPGAVAIYGLTRVYPELGFLVRDGQLSVGGFGLLLIIAYVAGHLIQSLGNLVEWCWWKVCGGWPSDWVRTRKHNILAVVQWEVLSKRIHDLLCLECPEDLNAVTQNDWKAITRQVYAEVLKAGRATRVDIFNGNYGMFRGVASSLLVITIAALCKFDTNSWRLYAALVIMLGFALLRMHRFGVHYARELFVQFISIKPAERSEAKKET